MKIHYLVFPSIVDVWLIKSVCGCGGSMDVFSLTGEI